MSSIQDNAMHVWVNGETITLADLEQNRKVFRDSINDNQSQISAQYTNAQIDAKVNTASSTTKVVQAGTVFPTTGLVDGQEFYRDDLHIMYIYDAALNKWVDRGSIASQGFRNLLDPSKQSFTRSSNATRKDLTPVPFNVLRREQGKFGQGAFIEEATTEIVQNNDFETITGTATVFNDAMTAGTTADPAWTTQSGSFTWSTSGATSGATGSYLSAGNNVWKPLTGSNGTALALTVQATFTTSATVPKNMELDLLVDLSNRYKFVWQSDNNLLLYKNVSGVQTGLANTTASTQSASTAYTMTLSVTPSGVLTAKLYSGVGTGGTLLQTLTATDTSLTGGFLIGVGGDTGVIIKNAQVTAPFADGWSIGGDQRIAWALTSSAISGSYSVSGVGVSGVQGWLYQNQSSISASTAYTLSGFMSTTNVGSSGAWMEFDVSSLSNATTTKITGTTNNQRYNVLVTTPSGTPTSHIGLVLNDTGAVIFDAIQLEAKSYPTTYVRNDSTSASATRQADSLSYTLSNPLPSRYFDAIVWTPEQSSSNQARNPVLYEATNTAGTERYRVQLYNGALMFSKFTPTQYYLSTSTNPTFNALDRIFVAWMDDPTTGYMYLWYGVNGGALTALTLADTHVITDAQKVYVGGTVNPGFEANGAIDFPILTDILPTTDQVQALYQASDWGGGRNYPIYSSSTLLKVDNAQKVTTPDGIALLKALGGGYKIQSVSGISATTPAATGVQTIGTFSLSQTFSNSNYVIVPFVTSSLGTVKTLEAVPSSASQFTLYGDVGNISTGFTFGYIAIGS